MKHNMGKSERFLRIFLGIAFIVVSLLLGSSGILALQLITAFAGLALTITGVFSYCPVNAFVRHNSCRACEVGETHAHRPV